MCYNEFMKEYALNYYPNFKCTADKCKHTCCAGWEMCIDEIALQKYRQEKSSFAPTLANGINFKKSKFKADKNGRCAFLNGQGLCEIIINLGEQSLCQVCTDHPRFRSFFDDRVELGLGFCCEEATRLILSFEEKISPVLTKDDGKEQTLGFIQKSVLEFRQSALNVVQDRQKDVNDRINDLLHLCKAKINEKDFGKILKAFRSFEKLDNSWAKRLKSLKDKPFEMDTASSLSTYCEQFLVNGLYRHLSGAEDTLCARARVVALVLSWWIIKAILQNEATGKNPTFELVVDVVRAFSAEVEYSQKNLDKLFALAFRFIKL